MNHSTPQEKHLANGTKLVAKRASRTTLCLALACLGALFALYPFSAEGKREQAQGKDQAASSQGEMQRTPIEMKASAVVDFAELQRQEALNPSVSEPIPRAIAPPKTIEEREEKGELSAISAAAPIDLPGPLIPSPAPATNFAGLDDIPFAPPGTPFFTIPPDTMGAVGPDSLDRVFTTLNNNYRIQNKSGVQIGSDVSMTNFWAPTGSASPFDPRVQYDPYNDRWIVAGVSNAGTANTSILVGVSATNDPGGMYFLFRVPARITGDAANVNFADFPMLGFNKNWVVVSINMFISGGGFSNERVLVLNYPTLRTGAAQGTYFTGLTDFCMHPATTYSATEDTEYLVSHLSSGGATYRLTTLTGTPALPVLTLGTVKVRPGGGWTQPGGNSLPQAMGTCATTPMKLESGDAFVRSNVVFRNSSIWYPQTIGLPAGRTALTVDRTAAQWTQLDTAGNVVQGGRVEDPTATPTNGGKWYSYPSISVNTSNDVLFGFSQFASNQFASAGYTYRDRTDAAGTMRDPVIFKAGDDCYSKDFNTGRNRWGDYSHTMVDPTNDCNLWTIQEYAKLQAPPTVGGSTSKWGTWWAKVVPLAICVPPPPLIVAAGATLTTESCVPANGVADPGERVTVNLNVTNNGGSSTTNLVGTLLASANVVAPSDPQTYGAIAPAGSAARDFSFTVNGSCGETITLMLQLQDGSTNLGTITYTLTLGQIVNTAPTYTENFDGVTAPALPAGWTTAFVLPGGKAWTTTTSFSDTAPNSAATIADVQGNLTTCVGGQGGSEMTSPAIPIPTPPVGGNSSVQLRFRNFFNLEAGFDGGVLEISINGAPFQDILAAGGSFVSGGYNDTLGIDPGNPLSGRAAWSGSSSGFITTLVNLPASASGQNVQFKWRTGYDGCFTPANAGMRIDTISIFGSSSICTTPCGGVRLVTSSTLACTSPSNVQAMITVSNTGTLSANNVTLTIAKLGSTDGTPLPQSLGTIAPGGSATATVNFASSGGTTLTTGGTYTGGTFNSTKRVNISCNSASPSKY